MEAAGATTPSGLWAAGEVYEPYVGRWSRLVTVPFLDWLEVPPGGRWLDVGCGTGALTATILDRCAPATVVGIDRSDGFVAYARRHLPDPRVAFKQGDAQALPVEDGSFDAVVSALMLNFVADHQAALAEMRRAAHPGGRIAAYVWDYAEGMELMRRFWDAAKELDLNGAGQHDEAVLYAICQPDPLRRLFEEAGLKAVDTRAIEVPTVFKDFEDYWKPFLGGQAPAPAYCMALDEERRHTLRERLRTMLPVEPDGRIHLSARAWAVCGTV